MSAGEQLLSIRNLVVRYQAGRRHAGAPPAVAGVSFDVGAGELVGLVGESGSGKSSIAGAILGLAPVGSGEVRLLGQRLGGRSGAAVRRLRRPAQLVMQDPFDSLNPHMTVTALVEEPMIVHGLERGRERRAARALELLDAVGLRPAHDFAARRPHELSGGQRQRVSIAAALAAEPALLIADEPVSMLDVSVRAGILHLLDAMCRERRMGILMITHDLPTAMAFCDRLLVMRHGHVVASGTPGEIRDQTLDAYTRELINAASPGLGVAPQET
ncbi:MAG: ABC transporter ATP-binding protein [Actinobacteria bacterium]|nr:ABC transporter ATP-binding protein [Actinomycetota bacterium]